MKSVFIISEYNPFHNGHAYQIQKIREEVAPTAVVAIMSGNFLQRGGPAIFDKFTRARLAVKGGCDLVVELPAVYATSSAEFFARGGVSIANALDPAGTLSFGSESGDTQKIITVSNTLIKENDRLDAVIRQGLDQGYTYPRARSEAFRQVTGRADLTNYLQSPNNTLAVEYVKAALELGSTLSFHTVRRLGMGYHDTLGGEDPAPGVGTAFPSATAMRQELARGNTDFVLSGMPRANQALFNESLANRLLPESDRLKTLVLYRLSLFPAAIGKIPEARDGLGERVLNSSHHLASTSLHEFALLVKTRRFTYTRICRLLLHLALGFDELDYGARRKALPEYVRILALNERGRTFLKETRKTRQIEVIQTATAVPEELFRPDLHAARLYSLLNPACRADLDFTYQLRVD